MALSPGDNVLVLGKGPVMLLAAKLAALRGYDTTCAIAADYGDAKDAKRLIFGSEPDDSFRLSERLTLLPASPSTAGFDPNMARAAIASADGVIVAFDDDVTADASILNTWIPADRSRAKHISFMSRYLNGAGMGFTVNAAKMAANPEIWAAGANQIRA